MFGGLIESLSLAQTGGSSTSRGVATDCAGMRKGWGVAGVASRGVSWWGVCVTIHGLRMRVSGWGGERGGEVTRSQPPRGLSRMGQTEGVHSRFVMVCRNSKTARNRDFREVCTHLPFRTRCDTRVLVLGGFVSTYVATSQPLSQSDPSFQLQ